jgi:hypothetical protein
MNSIASVQGLTRVLDPVTTLHCTIDSSIRQLPALAPAVGEQ